MADDISQTSPVNRLHDIVRQCDRIINELSGRARNVHVYNRVSARTYRRKPARNRNNKQRHRAIIAGQCVDSGRDFDWDASRNCENVNNNNNHRENFSSSDESSCTGHRNNGHIARDTVEQKIFSLSVEDVRLNEESTLDTSDWQNESPDTIVPADDAEFGSHEITLAEEMTDVNSNRTAEISEFIQEQSTEMVSANKVDNEKPSEVVTCAQSKTDRTTAKRYPTIRSYSEIGARELKRQTDHAECAGTTNSVHMSLEEYIRVPEQQVVINIKEKHTPEYVYITGTVENKRPSSPHLFDKASLDINAASAAQIPDTPPPPRSPTSHSKSAAMFDIVGLRSSARFPWQKDVGIQCGLEETPSVCVKRRGQKHYLSVDSATRAEQMTSRHAEHSGAEHAGQGRRPRPLSTSDAILYKKHHRKKKRSVSSSPGSHSTDSSAVRKQASAICQKSHSDDLVTTTENMTMNESEPTRQMSDDSGIAGRMDTLPSPQLSRVPWYKETLPELVVTPLSSRDLQAEEEQVAEISQMNRYLTVPGRAWRRSGSGSLHSGSDDSDVEPSPPVSRRGRRQAIFDPKSLGLVSAPDGDVSPTNSCDEADGNNSCNSQHTDKPRRKRSSADLGVTYPGDLLVRRHHHKKVLIKRNTIADFAVNKAFQSSTANLITEQDSKKLKGTFSLLKLIDKKTHKAKDSTSALTDVLQSLKPSEFKDTHITCYKDLHWSELIARKEKEVDVPVLSEMERKRREAVWELFKSECVFLVDHIMVLKHCFMEPMKKVQVEGHLMFAEPQDIFGNLDELCYVSYTFCRDFISSLLKGSDDADFGSTAVVSHALQRLSQLTRDGEVYHEYCLNYSKAMLYLEQLRKNDDFCEFEKYCEQDSRCHRLQLTDLLISPMHRCTKVPLLLNKIRKYTEDLGEKQHLTASLEKLEASLKSLEVKMKWLTNFERVQEIQQQVIWQPIMELEPRAFIPEFLRNKLSRQPCERLLASPRRQLLHEGALTLLEVSKTVDMYMFLFDDILLLTRVKKPPRKKLSDPSQRIQTDGAVFIVHKQPIALDRFTVHDIRPPDASVNGLKNAFVLVQISRFQQIIGVFTLQAPTESAKTTWLNHLHEAQDRYKASVDAQGRVNPTTSEDTASFDRSVDVEVNISTADDDDDSESACSSRSPWDTQPNSRQHHVSCESFESRDTHTTHVVSSSDESADEKSAPLVRVTDSHSSFLSTTPSVIAPCKANAEEDSLASNSVAEAILSPRTKRLQRLNAIREKSQSLDAIFI